VEQFQVENVQLGPATFGVIQGRITFPKHGMWLLEFVVSRFLFLLFLALFCFLFFLPYL